MKFTILTLLTLALISLLLPELSLAKSAAAKAAAKATHTESMNSAGNSAAPAQGQFGLGFMVGTIVSATGKYWLSEHGAIDFGIGFIGAPWVAIYSDYLWHIPKIFGTNSKWGRESALYFGGGGGLGFWNGSDHACGHWSCNWNSTDSKSGTGVFIRGIVGVEWYPLTTRFGVFGELGPSVMLAPGTWAAADIAVGGRWYF